MAGYLPAAPSRDFTVPEFSGKRAQWWDRQFQAAEYQPDGAGYAMMPDDYTPKFTEGGSLSGHRRTHRILYKGAGVALRMPSATAIERYSTETGLTFGVPVSAAFPGGTVTGSVRVTHNGAGLWSESSNGFTPELAAYVCEGVSAILEARRPSMGLKQAGDLLERDRAGSPPAESVSTRRRSPRSSQVSVTSDRPAPCSSASAPARTDTRYR